MSKGLKGGTGRGAIRKGLQDWKMGAGSKGRCVDETGREWKGMEASIEMLLGVVEVWVALSATGAPESHSESRICHRMIWEHPFLCLSAKLLMVDDNRSSLVQELDWDSKLLKGDEHDDVE